MKVKITGNNIDEHALCYRMFFLLNGEKDQLFQHSFTGNSFTEIISLETFKIYQWFSWGSHLTIHSHQTDK